MIQLNLLPDVKLEYIKAQRTRKTITSLAILVTMVSVGILVIMLGMGFAQKARIANVNKSIEANTKELKSKKDIDKVLTVQNQLTSLNQLHSEKPAVSSLFSYLNQVTPTTVSINDLHVDFAQGSEKITITGKSDSLSNVNKYVDTLKFTKFATDTDSTERKAFSNVVLTSFSLSNGSATKGADPATYTIDLSYDPEIFDITKKVTLKVPKQTTTRSSVDSPGNVFQGSEGSQN